ncbi:MAG: class II glutamine amidotransferase, partial [Ensifer adhaerens]
PSGGYCLVSEPLNDDDGAWVEIPDGTAVIVGENGVDVRLFSTQGAPVRKHRSA